MASWEDSMKDQFKNLTEKMSDLLSKLPQTDDDAHLTKHQKYATNITSNINSSKDDFEKLIEEEKKDGLRIASWNVNKISSNTITDSRLNASHYY